MSIVATIGFWIALFVSTYLLQDGIVELARRNNDDVRSVSSTSCFGAILALEVLFTGLPYVLFKQVFPGTVFAVILHCAGVILFGLFICKAICQLYRLLFAFGAYVVAVILTANGTYLSTRLDYMSIISIVLVTSLLAVTARFFIFRHTENEEEEVTESEENEEDFSEDSPEVKFPSWVFTFVLVVVFLFACKFFLSQMGII